MHRNLFGGQCGSSITGSHHAVQINGQAVADIHHGMNVAVGSQPFRLFESRFKQLMTSGCQTTSQRSGDEQCISRPGTRPKNGPVTKRFSRHADVDSKRSFP